MKFRKFFILHFFIKKLRIEFLVFYVAKLLNLPIWKMLPQNIDYKLNDNIISCDIRGINYYLNRNDFTQWQVYARYPELHYEAFLQTKKKGNVIDIGSNIGSFCLPVAKYMKLSNWKNKVYCFEPYNKIYEILNKNISINNDLRKYLIVENIALSEIIGEKMKFKIITSNHGANFLEKPSYDNDKNLIITNTLDNYCSNNKIQNVSFIKIDVEGMELEVLKGAMNTLERDNPSIFIEVNEKKYNKKNLSIIPFLELFYSKNKLFYIENKHDRNLIKKNFIEILDILKRSKDNFNLYVS